MFKLESYITPLLMGYIDKYVKLKHEDFQLSLWGGDAVLNKLDLRLDAIEESLHLPISFKSGQIYELRIHVPWTKLGSEPVVITINTIECILKLRDSATEGSDSASTTSAASVRPPTVKPKMKRQDTDDLPPGYLQSLFNRIINNVNIVINNLILKFVEDDIVLSANVKSAECYSVNHEWLRAFTELSMPELVLRKMVNFHDLTVCLDRRNADGKIETYQDPFLYRCSLSCRMHMIYDSLNSKLPSITKFNLLCEELNLSLTDTQVPMFFRLMELCIAIYYGTLELPDSGDQGENVKEGPHEQHAERYQHSGEDGPQSSEGWATWAWSYVPQILPDYEDEDEYGDAHCKQEPAVLCIGSYINKASITFKLSTSNQESGFGPSKVTFKPCMTWYADGISLEILLRGLFFFNAQFGICSTHVVCQGDAMCGVRDVEGTSRDPMIGRSTLASMDQNPDGFKTNSLFDPGGAENQAERPLYTFDFSAHLELFSESYALQRYGALWMDYVYTMEEPQEAAAGGSQPSGGSQGNQEELKEDSCLRFIVGPLQLILSSSGVQRLEKFYSCMLDHDYEPYSKPQPDPVDDSKGPPTEAEIIAVQEYIAKRSYQVSFIQPTIWFKAADLPQVDKLKTVGSSRKKKKKSKSSSDGAESCEAETLPMLVFYVDRVDMTTNMPMYPYKLARIVSKIATPSPNLLHQCHSHTYFKVSQALMGLSRMESDGSVDPIQNILHPWHGTFYTKTLLFPVFWKNPMQPHLEKRVELSGATVTMTKAHLLLITHVLLSWTQSRPNPSKLHQLSLLQEVFEQLDTEGRPLQAVLQFSLLGVKAADCLSPAARSLQLSVDTVLLQMLKTDGDQLEVTPLLHTQVDTSRIPNQWFFLQPLEEAAPQIRGNAVIVTVQIPCNIETPAAPAVVLVHMKGMVGCLDPVLFDWLGYVPKVTTSANQKAGSGTKLQVPGLVDQSLADSTSPLKNKQTSHGSQSGSARTTVPTDTHTPSLSRTQSKSFRLGTAKLEETEDLTKTTDDPPGSAVTAWGTKLAKLFPVVKIMQMQVEVEHLCGFVPKRHIKFPEPVGMSNIPRTLHEMYTRRILPETLVVSCPQVKLHSVGHKPIDAAPTLPIKALPQSVAGDKLPWSLQVSSCSVYTIHQASQLHYILEPASVSTTIAVTTKYTPPTSDNITSLGLVLHADIDTLVMSCSQRQMQLLYDLSQRAIGVSEHMVTSYTVMRDTVWKPDTPAEQTHEASGPQMPSTSPMLPTRPVYHTSNSSQWEPADVVVTETSESLSREPTPVRELEAASDVKLSLWLQWTLPRFLWKMYGENISNGTAMCLVGELEDLNSSVDIQDVYAKVKCRVGAFNIKHLEKDIARGLWKQGDLAGIILTCDEKLSRNVHIAANKLWSPGQPKVNLFSDIKPRDKTHGFFNFTYTRALRRNVKKRLKKINGEMEEGEKREKDRQSSSDLGVVYLNEVCLNVHPCDVVVNCPVICDALSVFAIDTGMKRSKSKHAPFKHAGADAADSIPKPKSLPILRSSMLPLLYINTANFRVFVPTCDTQVEESSPLGSSQERPGLEKPDKTLPQKPDVCVIQMTALSIAPQADNPLPRVVIEKDLYRRALHLGMTSQPGAEVEDRQYQLDIAGLRMSTGHWHNYLAGSPKPGSKQQAEVSVQNPALEWNNLTKAQEENAVVKMIPVASSFDMRIVAAPAVTYAPSPTFPEYRESVVVCGYSLEVNSTSDMDFFMATSQIRLALEIWETNMSAITKLSLTPDDMQLDSAASLAEQMRDELGVNDSGVESEISIFITPKEDYDGYAPQENITHGKCAVDCSDMIPFEVLLTAGKISCMVYGHSEPESPQSQEKVTSSHRHRQSRSKTDLDWKGEVQSMATMSSADSGLDSIAGSVSQGITAAGSSSHKIVPFLYAHFSQPHTLLNCHPGSQKAELSCYDIVLKGPCPGHTIIDINKQIPDISDYAIHWIETRPGKPSPKTGIPPSLYTLTLIDFLTQVRLKFERPLKVIASLSKVDQCLAFLKEVMPIMSEYQSNTSTPPSDLEDDEKFSEVPKNPPSFLQSLSCLRSVHLSMVQSIVVTETSSNADQACALFSMSAMQADLDFLVGNKGCVEEITLLVDVNDVMAKTAYCGTWRPLIGPVTASLSVSSQWQACSGPPDMPVLHCCVDAGVLQCFLGQEHIMAANQLIEHLNTYLKTLSSKSHTGESDDKDRSSSRKVSDVIAPNQVAVVQDSLVNSSEDDLRAGDFAYIPDEVDLEFLPGVGEICFSKDPLDGSAVMAWTYSLPRVITNLVVTPVPLSVPAIDVRYMEENLKLACCLQYWDEVTKEFTDYNHFHISENETCKADLLDMGPENAASIIAAKTWRVIILNPAKHVVDREEELPELEPLISPLTLAASLRVDSTFDPRYVALLRCSLKCSLVEVHLANHLQHLGKATPKKLSPFVLTEPATSDQEYMILTLDRPAFMLSYMDGQFRRLHAKVRSQVECELLEFRNLSMQRLLDPVQMEGETRWMHHDMYPRLETRLDANHIQLRVGASTMHTLNGAAQLMAQVLSPEPSTDQIPMHYYLLCNDTQETLHVKQAGTNEDLVIGSRQCLPYSWRTQRTEQLLVLSLDSISGIWCEPLGLDQDGSTVRFIESKGQRSSLIICIRQITGVQKQITIRGVIGVSSRLTQHLEVKMMTHKHGESVSVLGAGQTLPSYVLEHEQVRAIRVRLMGIKTPWSQEVVVSGDKMAITRLLKVPLYDKSGYIHVWCHIFVRNYNAAQQHLLVFAPLFVVRSQLPAPLLVNVETPRLKNEHQVQVKGQGHEEQLHLVAGDMTHAITFQLSTGMQTSSPPISLSSGMIEQVECTAASDKDLDHLMRNMVEDSTNGWPYNQPEGTRSVDTVKDLPVSNHHEVVMTAGSQEPVLSTDFHAMEQPNIDLQVALTQRWPGCNTLLIDVSPHWMIVNETEVDFVILEKNDSQWNLPKRQTFAPPPFESTFQLGIIRNGHIHLSEELSLSDEERTYHYHADLEGTLRRWGHIKVVVPLKDGVNVTKVCHLVVHSTMKDSLRVVTVRERYVLSCQSRMSLSVQGYTLPLSSNKFTYNHQKAYTTSIMPEQVTPLAFWNIPQEVNQEMLGSLQTNSVLYVTFRSNHDLEGKEGQGDARSTWSLPSRICTTSGGMRCNFVVPMATSRQQQACVMTCHESNGVTYLVVKEEAYPAIEIHNNCQFAIHFGQTLKDVNVEGATVQEEAELTHDIPLVLAHDSAYYAFPACNHNFPESTAPEDLPKLHLAGTTSGNEGTLIWSHGIDMAAEHDVFVTIPDLSDVKVHVERVCHTTHVFIDPVSRAEVSAKEIRSRIKGKEKTVVVEGKKERSGSFKDSPPRDLVSRKDEKNKQHTYVTFLAKFQLQCKLCALVLLDEYSSTREVQELLHITTDNLVCMIEPNLEQTLDVTTNRQLHAKYSILFGVGDIQVDNQLFPNGFYDFPVILLKQPGVESQLTFKDWGSLNGAEKRAAIKQLSVICVEVCLTSDLCKDKVTLDTLDIASKPLTMYVEDVLIYDVLKRIDQFIPTSLSVLEKRSDVVLPLDVRWASANLSHPVRIEMLSVQPLSIMLSVHASLKLFIASDNTPLKFGKFEKKSLFTSTSNLSKALVMHYASGALFRAGLVVGSLEILGNPTGLIRSIGTGVTDLFRMPYQGLTKGPGAFIAGVTRGMASLLRHISTGTLTSITNFASSVSRNMDRLSLDADHRERQEESRRVKPAGLSQGLMQGLTGLGISLLGAIAGIADQPLQSLHWAADAEVPSTATSKATGLVSGVGKGLVGAFTKPIGGAAELVSQTGMGLLHGVGLTAFPKPRCSPVSVSMESLPNGTLKYLEKYAQSVPNAELLMCLPSVHVDSRGHLESMSLLLTPHVLFLINVKRDVQVHALSVQEVDTRGSEEDPCVLYVILQDKSDHEAPWKPDGIDNKDRLVAFIGGTTDFPVSSEKRYGGTPYVDGRPLVKEGSNYKTFELQVEPRLGALFLSLFSQAKTKGMGTGFPV